jgi:hypothetical protein
MTRYALSTTMYDSALLVSPTALTEYEQAGDYASHAGYEKLFQGVFVRSRCYQWPVSRGIALPFCPRRLSLVVF